jgi:uncharacterized protein (TIGR02996 family)
MPDESSLIQAILASPEDDSARLAYADWLSERGNPRGELIRVQVTLARGVSDTAALQEQERELLARHQEEWLAELVTFGCNWEFDRGFVSKGAIAASTFRDQSAAIFRAAPLLRSVRFTHVSECLNFLDWTALETLTALDLSGQLLDDPEGWRLWGAPLGNLQSLNLSANRIDPDNLFWGSDNGFSLPSLRHLDLSHNDLKSTGAFCGPANGEFLPAQIEHLNLSGNLIADVSGFIHSSAVGCLRTLDLSDNELDIEAVAGLFESENLQKLSNLNLAHNKLSVEPPEEWTRQPMPRILESAMFQRLECLDLSSNPLGENAFWHFCSCYMYDEHGEPWRVSRGSVWVPIYSADGKSRTNYAPGKITVPERLILRDTGMDDFWRSQLCREFGDRIVL